MIAVIAETGEEVPIGDNRLFDFESNPARVRYHTVKPCTCTEQKRVERLFKSSNIPEKYKNAGFKNFVVNGRPQAIREARDVAVDYYTRFEDIRHSETNGIMLVGHPDTGKTHLLMAVANGLMRKGISVLYFPWVEGMDELKEDFDEMHERVNFMKSVDVLYIDDLYKGRDRITDFSRERIYGVINYRYNNQLPTMVSSEYTPDDLYHIDTGIARRICAPSKGHRVLMDLTDEERAAGMELNYSLAGEGDA